MTQSTSKRSVRAFGFSLYCGPRISPTSTRRIETLCRYIARPPIALERLSITKDGQILIQLKRPFQDGTHSVLLSPIAFLERLAALIPRPRRHLLTYHGALAPASPMRDGPEDESPAGALSSRS